MKILLVAIFWCSISSVTAHYFLTKEHNKQITAVNSSLLASQKKYRDLVKHRSDAGCIFVENYADWSSVLGTKK